MESLVHAFLSNALVAAGLGLIPLILGRANRSPALVHALWIVVLIKLVTPPLLPISVAIPAPAAMESEQASPDRGASPVIETSLAHQHESTGAGLVEIPKVPEQA